MNRATLQLLNRLLIVDDDNAYMSIVEELVTEFPGRQIFKNKALIPECDAEASEPADTPLYVDVAATVPEGLALITNSVETNELYDVAIIDYKLPAEQGRQPEGDFRAATLLARKSHSTIVIRLTSYPNDPMLREIEGDTEREPYMELLFVDKNAEDWWPTLWLKMIMALHTRRLRRRMAELLGQEDPVGVPVSLRSRKAGTLNRCFEERWQRLKLADFYTDAAEHWDLLARALQQDIEREFGCRIIDGQRVIGAGSDKVDEGEEADLQPRRDS